MLSYLLMDTNFIQWTKSKMEERDWKQSDLARHSGLSDPMISKLLAGLRGPGKDTCIKIAKAFQVPVDTVLRVAGYAPPIAPKDETAETLFHQIQALPPASRKVAEEYIEYLLSKHGKSDHTTAPTQSNR